MARGPLRGLRRGGPAADDLLVFTGATTQYLRSFGGDFPKATVVRLVRDYRSTPQVVNVANRLVAAAGDAEALVAQRHAGAREPSGDALRR